MSTAQTPGGTPLEHIERDLVKAGRVAGARGIVTPEMIDKMEPDRLARLVNSLFSRMNMDAAMEAKRRAIKVLVLWMSVTALVASLVTMLIMLFCFSPFDRLADAIEQSHKASK